MRKAIALSRRGVCRLGVHRYAGLRKSMSAVAPSCGIAAVLATTSIPFNWLTLPIVRFVDGP